MLGRLSLCSVFGHRIQAVHSLAEDSCDCAWEAWGEGQEKTHKSWRKGVKETSHLKGWHGGTYESSTCDGWEVIAQSCLKAELSGGEGHFTLVVLGTQALVAFESCGNCCKEGATGKPQTCSVGFSKKKNSQHAMGAVHACRYGGCW